MAMNPRLLAPRAASGPPLLLDIYKDAECAYSLRLIRRAYKGPVVRVRSTGAGSPEADFTAREIASGALASFVGAGNDGRVRTWYDQSGNGRHANQATAASQPIIVSNGAVVVDAKGKPTIQFVSASHSLVGSVINAVFLFQVMRYASAASVINFMSTRVASNQGVSFDNQSDIFRARFFGSSGSVVVSPQPAIAGTTFQRLYTTRHVNASFAAWVDGGTETTSSSSIGLVTQSTQALSIGARTGDSGGVNFSGEASELIFYGTDRTSNRTAIEADIRAFYGL